MELTDLKSGERVVEILHPGSGEPVGIRVTLISINDDRLKKLKRRIQDERLRLEQKGKGFKSEDLEENGYALINSAMTGWEWYGDITFNGTKPDFNQKNVTDVVSAFPWFKNQIDEAISDESAFFQT